MDLTKLYDIPASDIARESFFNVGGPHGFMRWGIYIPALIAVIYIIYSIIQRVRIWRVGKDELRTDYPEKRIWAVIKYVFMQIKILREAYAGLMHAALFFGFAGLFIVTLIIMVNDDITELFYHYKFLTGNFYLYWSLAADLFGLLVLVGLAMALYRRYITKPSRLDTQPIDTFALVFLVILTLSGFTTEALRIAITGFPPFEVWSPVGYAMAYSISWMSTPALKVTHYLNWWIHVICAFIFIGLIATDKLGHILISSLNVYFQNLDNENPKTKYTHNVMDPCEFETAECFGCGNIEDFTWKQLMDSDACTRCGRCQDNCPAWLTEKPLSPKKIQIDTKTAMDEKIPLVLKCDDTAPVMSKALIGEYVLEDEIWSCTNCAACMEVCPVQIEHVPKINGMRRYKILMEGVMSTELQTTFTNMENNSNPYGFTFAARGDWVPEDLNLKTIAEDPEVDFLYYTGCATAYDQRSIKIAIALVKVMQKAGYKIGILGPEEACCGDSAMRAGNEYLFHMLATQNLETFKNYGIKKIVTTCPHGYNMLKKEYPRFAQLGVDSSGEPLSCDYEVYHHTEIIMDILKKGQIKLVEALNEKVTYHDSCFLGRYNNIYDEPRNIIKSIPGASLVEMSRHHRTSFCCGAGGARMWLEENLGTRINQFRTKDAQSTGATRICTACPFCLTMLSDGVTELDIPNMETYDIVEFVYNSMEK